MSSKTFCLCSSEMYLRLGHMNKLSLFLVLKFTTCTGETWLLEIHLFVKCILTEEVE